MTNEEHDGGDDADLDAPAQIARGLRLSQKISAYWSKRGYAVDAKLVRGWVRSDMTGGKPKTAKDAVI